MKKLLVITSSPMRESMSNQLANFFAKGVKGRTIEFVDLTKIVIPKYTEIIDKIVSGKATDGEVFENRSSMEVINRLHEQFMEADEYVFTFPNWNLMCPPDMVAYMLSVMRVGATFKYTNQGSVGLLENKKALILTSSGGMYTENLTSLGVDWMKQALLLMGIDDQYIVAAEGVEMPPFDRGLVLGKAIAKLEDVMKFF